MNEFLFRQYLAPLQEAVAELQEMAETNRRQGNNFINKGVVVSAPEGRRVVVQIGENRTPPIQFLVPAAGKVIQYRCPSPGEIAIVLNFGSGDNFQSCIALCGLESASFPFPVFDPDIAMTAYGEKAFTRVSLETGKMEIHAAGGVEFVDTPEVVNRSGEVADRTRSMSEDRKIYDGHDHNGVHGKTSPPNQKQGG